jgi:uncharacterized protein (DUF488 family)
VARHHSAVVVSIPAICCEVLMLTIGHSNRTIEELITMLAAHGVDLLADVRSVPRSRHNPQFSQENLPGTLGDAQIEYVHLRALGGLRRPRPDSINTAWRHPSFRGYADYMQSTEFAAGLADLLELNARRRVAIMCAEAVPWRCHRSLIADALTVRGIPVEHIMTAGRADRHKLTSFARVDGVVVTYPSPELGLFE